MNKLIYFLLLFSIQLNAQQSSDSLYFNIDVLFDTKTIDNDSNYISKVNDTLSFSTIKFYLSAFEFHFTDNSIYKETNSYHLVDIEKPNSKQLSFSKLHFKNKEIKSVQFNIGIDSLMSVSGALKGDLDPTKGMYWAWQSGYINMKIEGESSSCTTRKNKFQFHIGGYLKPNYALRNVNIKFNDNSNSNSNSNSKNKINLVMDLGKLFSEISLKETNTIMIPGNEAMHLADLSAKIFFIQ
jgi:hypothetical protein